MNIISKPTLEKFWLNHTDSKKDLIDWYNISKKAEWQNPNAKKRICQMLAILKIVE
jgi:mRNA-degrading endonuclease HigB of HigAB toxin-antitoxin module